MMIKSTVVNPLRAPVERMLREYIDQGGKVERLKPGQSGLAIDPNAGKRDWGYTGVYTGF